MYHEKTKKEEKDNAQNLKQTFLTTLEQFPENSTARKLMSSVTKNCFYENSYVGKWLFQALGIEWEDAKQRLEELKAQIFYNTAEWGLIYHEQKYGLPSRGTIEERRQRIRKKIMQTLPFNPALLCKNLSSLSGLAPEKILISENTAPYTFMIEFCENDNSGDGARVAREYTMRIKPSHLRLEALRKYCGTAWEEIETVSGMTTQSSFYPRYNLELLILNGSWGLEGDYFLNGYKIGRKVEFYPARLQLESSFYVPGTENSEMLFDSGIFAKQGLNGGNTYFNSVYWKLYSHFIEIFLTRFPKLARLEAAGTVSLTAHWEIIYHLQPVIRSLAGTETGHQLFLLLFSASRQQLKLKTETHYKSWQIQQIAWNGTFGSTTVAKGQPKAARRIVFRSKVVQETSSNFKLDVEKDLWYLNGRTLLDGNRRLDADIFHYEL